MEVTRCWWPVISIELEDGWIEIAGINTPGGAELVICFYQLLEDRIVGYRRALGWLPFSLLCLLLFHFLNLFDGFLFYLAFVIAEVGAVAGPCCPLGSRTSPARPATGVATMWGGPSGGGGG